MNNLLGNGASKLGGDFHLVLKPPLSRNVTFSAPPFIICFVIGLIIEDISPQAIYLVLRMMMFLMMSDVSRNLVKKENVAFQGLFLFTAAYHTQSGSGE